jgi:hypothetical protein
MSIGIRLGAFCVAFFSLVFLFMPALTPASPGFVYTLGITALLAAALPLPSDYKKEPYSNGYRLRASYSRRLWAVGGGFAAVLLLGALGSWSLFRADAYFGLLGEERQGTFEALLPPIDIQKAPLVSNSMAMRAAEKKLSEVPALGSQVSIGTLTKQLVRGDLYWVAFLEHRGFFKWFSRGSTPGYVMVSANDPSDVQLVTELDGKPMNLKFLDSAYFGNNQVRHLYLSGFANKMLTAFSPEIDETGRPYTVATIFERKVLWRGAEAVGTVVLDVQTGEFKSYSVEDTPAWVDRIQPETFVRTQLEDRLYLIHGWFNPSDKDRLGVSGDLDLVYGADGRSYYFAGHTSVAREGGLVSFSLIDTRTKEATRFTMSGVTERVAKAAAEGANPEKKYEATNALPFMVDGVPTYVMALRDSTGIARSYAMVAIEDFQKVAVAETLAATARQFQAKLTMDKTRLDTATSSELAKVTARVIRKGSEVRGGNTSYLLVLKGHHGKLFAAGPDLAETLAVTNEGDEVEVKFGNSTARVVGLVSFRNLTLEPKALAEDKNEPKQDVLVRAHEVKAP